MLIECTNCGAPLNVEQGSSFSRCRYCGRTQRVRAARTMAMQTPVGWQPPQQWTPPPQAQMQVVAPLQYDQSKSGLKVVIWIVVLTTVLPVVVFGFIMLIVGVGIFSAASEAGRPTKGDDSDEADRPAAVTDVTPKRQRGKRKKSGSGGVCARAARCCNQLTPSPGCNALEQQNDEAACQRMLESLQRAARQMGRPCD